MPPSAALKRALDMSEDDEGSQDQPTIKMARTDQSEITSLRDRVSQLEQTIKSTRTALSMAMSGLNRRNTIFIIAVQN